MLISPSWNHVAHMILWDAKIEICFFYLEEGEITDVGKRYQKRANRKPPNLRRSSIVLKK